MRRLPVTKYNNAVKFALCVACGFRHTLDGERLHRLHEQNAHAVEHQRADDEDEDDDEEGFDFGDEDTTIYEVECPSCGNIIDFDEETLEKGSIICDECGEKLEFAADDEDDDQE